MDAIRRSPKAGLSYGLPPKQSSAQPQLQSKGKKSTKEGSRATPGKRPGSSKNALLPRDAALSIAKKNSA